jgi:hypothetical protein
VDPLLSEFDSFVRTRTPALLRSAYLLTGDQHLAEDLARGHLSLFLGAGGAMVIRAHENGRPARIHEVSATGEVTSRPEPPALGNPFGHRA